MIIVWRGLGIVVLLIVGGVAAITQVAIYAMTGNPAYFENHAWPKLLSCSIAAGLVFFISKQRNQGGPSRDSLFFIPMWIWSFFILVGGLVWTAASVFDGLAAYQAQPTKVLARDSAHSQPRRVEQTVSAPAPMQMQPAKPELEPNELRLQGIIYVPGNRGTAQISHQTVVVGEQVLGYTVVSIEEQHVTLRSAAGETRTLQLSNIGR